MTLVRNKDGVESVIKNLDGKLSEAIMHAMTNGPELEKKVSHDAQNCMKMFRKCKISLHQQDDWDVAKFLTGPTKNFSLVSLSIEKNVDWGGREWVARCASTDYQFVGGPHTRLSENVAEEL